MDLISELFSTGPVVILKWKHLNGWPIIMASDNVHQLTGYQPYEITHDGFGFGQLIHEEDRDALMHGIAKNLEQGSRRFSHAPFRLKTKDGDSIWVDNQMTANTVDNDENVHLIGYFFDVTAKVESETRLAAVEHKLISTLASIDDLIFVLDENGYYTEFYSNESDSDLFAQPSEFIGKHFNEVMPADNAQLIDKYLGKIKASKTPVSFEYELVIEGTIKHFRCKITTNAERGNDVDKFTFVVSNITKQKQFQEKIDEYYKLFSKSNDMLAISTFEGKVEAVNPLWEKKFGYDEGFVNEKGFLFFVHPADKATAYNALNSIRTGRPEVVKFDCRLRTSNNDYVWTEWVSTIDYENKKVYSVTRDITESKEEQARAQDISDRLFELIKKSLLLTESLPEFLEIITIDACDILQVDRFTYWELSGRSALRSVMSYDAVREEFVDLPDIQVDEYPNYLNAVANQRIISSVQPRTDPRFEELTQYYLGPHHIKSTMDASIIGEDGLEGVLCAETIRSERHWTSGDKRDLSSIAEILRTALYIHKKNITENELKKNRQLMYALSDHMPGQVYIKHPDGKHIYGNNSTLKYFGLTLEEYCNCTAHDLFSKNTADQLVANDWACIRSGKAIYSQLQDPNGKEIYYDEYKFPISIVGEDTLIGGIVIDVTEERKAQQQIIENEARYKLLVEFTDAAHWQVDLSTDQFTYMDEKIVDVTGYPASDFKTVDQWVAKIHPEEREEISRYSNQLTSKGEDHELVYRIVKPSGKVVWIKDSVSVITEDGRPSILIGYMIDITEQKNAEINLRASESRFRSLVNDIQVGILLQGPHSEMLLYNEKSLELLGLTKDQLLGKTSMDPDWKVIHVDGTKFPGYTHPIVQAISAKKPVNNVIMGVYRPDRSDHVWLQVDALPQVDQAGEVAEVICTFTDITKRVIAEQERNESFINLQMAEQIAELGYWSYDPITDEQVWSDQVYRIFEVAKEDYMPVYGKQNYRMTPSDSKKLDELRNKGINQGEGFDVSFKLRFETDRIKWIRLICRPTEIPGSTKYFSRGTVQDITAQKLVEEELVGFTQLQTLLMDLSSDFINMPNSRVHDSIIDTLQRLGEFVGIDRAYISRYDHDYSISTCTHRWVRTGIDDIPINQPMDMTHLTASIQTHRRGAYYQIEDIDQVDDAHVRRTYSAFNIKSMITIPLMLQENCIGFVGFDAVQTTKLFSPKETDLLKIFAELLVNLRQKVSYETSLVQKQRDLEKALYEKDTLFKELHHRIKNNLQLVSSLMFIKMDTISDPQTTSFINETITRILSISKIHDQLLKIEEVYELDIKTYLEDLTKNILNTYCENPALYPLDMAIDKSKFHIDDALIVGLLINESVSNIIKYAYDAETGGEIDIALQISDSDQVVLTIADKGRGLPFTSLDEASKSNGIQLIRVFVEQLKGSLSLDLTCGTRYTIEFAKKR